MLAETEAKLATAAPAKKASSMAYTEADNPSTGLIAPPMRAATEQRIQLFRLAHGNKAIEWHRRDKMGLHAEPPALNRDPTVDRIGVGLDNSPALRPGARSPHQGC